MTDSTPTKQGLRALAELSGLSINEELIAECWPVLQGTLEARERTRQIEIGEAQPASVFHAAPGDNVPSGRKDKMA